jgi:hypothetical protein
VQKRLALKVELAKRRCAALQASIDSGAQLEEFAQEYAVPD